MILNRKMAYFLGWALLGLGAFIQPLQVHAYTHEFRYVAVEEQHDRLRGVKSQTFSPKSTASGFSLKLEEGVFQVQGLMSDQDLKTIAGLYNDPTLPLHIKVKFEDWNASLDEANHLESIYLRGYTDEARLLNIMRQLKTYAFPVSSAAGETKKEGLMFLVSPAAELL
jgi:hypothetical protein